MTWTPLRIESDIDRSAMVVVLTKNGYEVRIGKRKVGSKLERYVEYRESEENDGA